MYNRHDFISEIVREWAYKLSDGKPDIKNEHHLIVLKEVLKKRKVPYEAIEEILNGLRGLKETSSLDSPTTAGFTKKMDFGNQSTGSHPPLDYINPIQPQDTDEQEPVQDDEEEPEEPETPEPEDSDTEKNENLLPELTLYLYDEKENVANEYKKTSISSDKLDSADLIELKCDIYENGKRTIYEGKFYELCCGLLIKEKDLEGII